jgi:hypothetical protein
VYTKGNDKGVNVLISKEAYVLERIKSLVTYSNQQDKMINPETLNNLIEQWSFDYEAEKIHRPEVLIEDETKDCTRCEGSGFLYDSMLHKKPCYVCDGKKFTQTMKEGGESLA